MDGVVVCSSGWHVVQRGVDAPVPGPALRVGPIRSVQLPRTPGVPSYSDVGEWRRHWSEPDRLVVRYVGVADVEVDDASGTVTFDRELHPEAEEHLLLDHILPLVLARAGELVLHGAVLQRNGAGVVLAGRSGSGKSTLAAFCAGLGWTVSGDDGAVLRHLADRLQVTPTYPSVRLLPDAAALLGVDTVDTQPIFGKLRVPGLVQAVAPTPLELVAMIAPTEDEPARFTQLVGAAAHVQLLGTTFHADLSGDARMGEVFDRLGDVVESTRVGILTVPRGLAGLRDAEAMLGRLTEQR